MGSWSSRRERIGQAIAAECREIDRGARVKEERNREWLATFNAALAGGKPEAEAREIADKVHGRMG